MSVATSDSGAGAGIQADLKAFLRCGVYGTTVIVATTAQNTVGVADIFPFPPEVAVRQMEVVAEDIGVDAVKTGMRSEEHTSELQSRQYLVCRLLLEKKKT